MPFELQHKTSPDSMKSILGTDQKTLLMKGGGFLIFTGEIWVSPSEDWQNLAIP